VIPASPNTPALRRIHHVAIICSDYARSKAFYTHVLGLSVIAENYRPERASWKLDLALPGGERIELFSFPVVPARPSQPEAGGLRHLAFAVDDLGAWSDHLRSQGIAVEPIRVDEYTGCRFTFFADPDGLPLELYETSAPRGPDSAGPDSADPDSADPDSAGPDSADPDSADPDSADPD